MSEKPDAIVPSKDISTAPLDSPADLATKGQTVFVAEADGKKNAGALDYLKGDAERHLTLFDKKASLINA